MYKILLKQDLVPDSIHLFKVEAPAIAKKAQAGQFVVVRIDEKGERVPLTIADSKGEVTYYNIKVREKLKRNAAWSYVEPLDEAKHIKGYVTFDKVVVRLEL